MRNSMRIKRSCTSLVVSFLVVTLLGPHSRRATAQNFPTVITTVAGGMQGSSLAINSSMRPESVAVDSAGNVYIADEASSVIRKVDSNGNISTVAGNNSFSYSGDNGPAIAAGLSRPSGIFVDSLGNLFIADSGNNVIRKVDHTTQIITTVAGGGAGCAGQTDSLGDGCMATSAIVPQPNAVAVDSFGNFFLSDTTNKIVRKVDTNGVITVYAGGGSGSTHGDGSPAINAYINGPAGLVVDGTGNLYIADSIDNIVFEVDTSAQHLITRVAGGTDCPGRLDGYGDGCVATQSELNSPEGVFIDGSGNLFIADMFNQIVRRVDHSTQIITIVAGGGATPTTCTGATDNLGDGCLATQSKLVIPQGVAADTNGNVFIADTGDSYIRRVGSNAIITIYAGNGTSTLGGDNGQATAASIGMPFGVSVDAANHILIADQLNNVIREVDAGGIITTIAGGGSTYVVVPGSTDTWCDGCLALQAILQGPTGVAENSSGDFFIADQGHDLVRRVDHTSLMITAAAGGGPYPPDACNGAVDSVGDGCLATQAYVSLPTSIALDTNGNLLVPDPGNNRVRRVDHATQIITSIAGTGNAQFSGDGGLATNAGLSPSSVVQDPAGNLYIADTGNNRIRKVDTNGYISTVAGGGINPSTCSGSVDALGDGCLATQAILNQDYGVAVNSVGDLFIADHNTHRVRRVDHATQIITSFAGNGRNGFSGDNGSAASAQLNSPSGVFVDTLGNVYIADEVNNRIRKVVTFPLATAASTSTFENTPLPITLSGVSPRGNVPLTFATASVPSHGSLSNFSASTGTVLYTPAASFIGSDSFTFTVNDGNAQSTLAVVTIVTSTPPPPPPDFTISASPTISTVRAGQSATITFTLTPVNSFNNSVSFACAGLPALTTCTFTPPSVTPNGSPVQSTLVINTTGPNASLFVPQFQNQREPVFAGLQLVGSFGVVGILLIPTRKMISRRQRQVSFTAGSLMLLMALTIVGCGGGGGTNLKPPPPPQTPTGTSTVTVTATSAAGSLSHAASVTLTVTQ